MKRIKDILYKYRYLLFSFLISFIGLLICSKNSLLYQFNDWVDANAFFTVGKGIFRGIIPYKDVFEQKGLFLYIIYGLGSLISFKSFHGVFIFEVLFFTVTLYYAHKIVGLFLDKKYTYIILPIFAMLLVTCKSFVHGGSAEELCLPFMLISLYYFILHFKDRQLSNKEFLLNGLCAGFVLMIKYTILGFWIGFMIYIIIDYLRKKDIKSAIVKSIYFLLGMSIPFILSLIYFVINSGVKEFINVYFITNMTAYVNDNSNWVHTFFNGIFNQYCSNGYFITVVLLLLPFLIHFLSKNKALNIGIIVLYVFTLFFIFSGLVFHAYYAYPVFIFTLIGLITIFKFMEKLLNKRITLFLSLMTLVLFPIECFTFANYKEDISKTREDYILYDYAEVINEDKGTFVNMGNLDMGIYTVGGILPSTYYFEKQNFSYSKYPYNLDAFDEYIENKSTDYILYSITTDIQALRNKNERLFENYTLIRDDTYVTEHTVYNMFLFKVKD